MTTSPTRPAPARAAIPALLDTAPREPPAAPLNGYRVVPRRALDHREVDDLRADAVVEVVLRWGDDALVAVAHLAAGGAFVLCADALSASRRRRADGTTHAPIDPALLGDARALPLVTHRGATARVTLPAGAAATLVDAAGTPRPLDAAPDAARVIELPRAARCTVALGAFTAHVRFAAPARRTPRMRARDRAATAAYAGALGASLLAIKTLLAVPAPHPLLSRGDEATRLAALRDRVARQQTREMTVTPATVRARRDGRTGGTGRAHQGAMGMMGRHDGPRRPAYYAIPARDERLRLARAAGSDIVANRGVFVALRSATGALQGGSSGVVSPFGELTESGRDRDAANGWMLGDAPGDAFGYGGLGLLGTGRGGGGTGEGTLGMGSIGTLGHGAGTGTGQGYGMGAGRGLRGRGTSGPIVLAATPSVCGDGSGGACPLSPEAIRRVVLRNIAQVRYCHEQGLASAGPSLAGRVVVRFIIGGDGQVMGANVSESSVPVPSVAQCIASAVRRWTFPEPSDGGVVTVNYPFQLEAAE